MISPHQITLIFAILGALLFAFIFWRDSTKEGFSSDKILDAFVLIFIGGVIGGKILFRSLDMSYFRYQILTAPLILEGVLVGGGLSAFYVIRRNKWSGWKIGDMIAPALIIFQIFLFLGFWLSTKVTSFLVTSLGFTALYIFIRFLKERKHLGTSVKFFELKRLNKLFFTGGLLAIYLTGSSVIAIIFLVTHRNYQSSFWWFQIIFYFVILTGSYILFKKQLNFQGIHMDPIGSIQNTLGKLYGRLVKRRSDVEKEQETLLKEDPFKRESEVEGGRNADELGDDIAELGGHQEVEAGKKILSQEKGEINKTLKKIKNKTYGKCEMCGKKISRKRLKAYPTVMLCLSCERKKESGKK